jgi:hypothetical protein
MEASSHVPSSPEVRAPHAGGPTDPSHDARLRRGIIDTHISRPVALSLTIVFLLFIYGIPLSQALQEKLADDESSLLPVFQRAPTKENLREFEKELEGASYAKEYVQPRVQAALSGWGRVGNKRAVVGRDGWLYYTPGLTHLVGPSFIAADQLALRQRAAGEGEESAGLQPDPRPAIFDFQHMLSQRGIKLILFPVPDKTMLQPRELSGRADAQTVVPVARNLGWSRFTAELSAHGVVLFDPAPAQLAPGEAPRFLIQDSHWTPAFMDAVARDLATTVRRVGALPPVTSAHTYHAVAQPAERVGDLVDMLKLPDAQTLFPPQTLTVEQVQDESGAVWDADPAADVLLLGDSFTNVFTLDAMGWGEAAGLAPHLSLALGRGVDVIAQNDSGAFATRQALARALASGEDRLKGKRVVIWEFASRELSVGDWKPMSWQPVAAGAP